MKKRLSVLSIATVLLLTGCGQQNESVKENRENSANTSEKTVENKDHLDYSNQKAWDFESGNFQSPIDIHTIDAEKIENSDSFVLGYADEADYIEDNGHSIQVGLSGHASINGRNFDLTQLHFHAESEHTIDGKHYPMECHFVNVAQDGRLAVIGVFLQEGAENESFQEILEHVQTGSKNEEKFVVNTQNLLPKSFNCYHYLGSLTTPPLTENVEWYVLSEPVEVSKNQLEKFQNYYSHNNRDVQNLNERPILEFVE